MSLGQLTASYTDSEGDDDSVSGSPAEGIMGRLVPKSHSNSPMGTNTPQKKVNRLVSYYNEDDDDEPIDVQEEEPDELLNPEPMDTGTDDGEDDKSDNSRPSHHGITLPPPPTAKCSQKLQDKVTKIVTDVKRGNKDYNAIIQHKKEFRNPSIYEKLIELLRLDEFGSNYPLEMFDAHCWDKESYYDNLARVQKEEMDKREKERKERTKVDYVSGTKKPIEEEAKKRKSRFDQVAHPIVNPVVPTLTAVPSGKKPTIEAFGQLKKPK